MTSQVAFHLVGGRRTVRYLCCLVIGICLGLIRADAATYYVDGNCPNSGSGSSLSCGSSGPKRTITEGLALLTSPGDVLNVRGIHAAHNGETADFDGRYHADRFLVTGRRGTLANPLIIQPYQYTGPDTGETVFIDGTINPTGGWTQCTDCASGLCAGVPGVCSETWHATSDPPALLVIGAQKPDGSPTYRVQSKADLTNNHGAAYAGTTCSASRWKRCYADSDCPASETCTGSSREIDSFRDTSISPNRLFVRWGTGADAPGGANNKKPYVFTNSNAYGFQVVDSTYVTIRGFIFRCHERSSVAISDELAGTFAPVAGIRVLDNQVFYNQDQEGSGSDYGIVIYGATDAEVSGNEIAFTGSEGIHTESRTNNQVSLLNITNNWFHDIGDQKVLGPGTRGTPHAVIFGEKGGGPGTGNYLGSVFGWNLVTNMRNQPGLSAGKGMILENDSDGWTIRDNVFYNLDGECLKMEAKGTTNYGASVNDHTVFNNLFIRCGLNPGGATQSGIYIYAGSGLEAKRNKIYNNTFVDVAGEALNIDCSGTCTDNWFRNNIMYDGGSQQLIRWSPPGPTNQFDNNLFYSVGRSTSCVSNCSVAQISGASFTCAQIVAAADLDRDGLPGDGNLCVNPAFASLSGLDLHLSLNSPAINVGTDSGMPPARTTSLNNALAGLHGLPNYGDNAAMVTVWDMGALEYTGPATPTANLVLSDLTPTAAGSVTVTLTTSVPVVLLPGPLTFLESDGSSTSVSLTGAVPGSVFVGTFLVNSTVADGLGTFSLPVDNLVNATGGKGNAIITGRQTVIDQTAPAAPTSVRIGP